jgi:RNA polymerase sporulation-specific sigma factor
MEMILNIQDLTDEDLVTYVNQGDQSAFNSILSRHMPMIRYFAMRYYASGLTSGDLFQVGSIGLFVACKKYNPHKGMAFTSFAKMHVKHHIINAVVTALRKKQQSLNQSESLDETPVPLEKMNRYELIPDFTPSPEEIYMEQVRNMELLHMLKEHLTDIERKAVLGLMNGLAYKDIADLTGVGIKSIDNALRRAKGKLKPVLHQLQNVSSVQA